MSLSVSRTGLARVWLGPEPEAGSHSNITGEVMADALGVHVAAGARYRFYEPGEWHKREDEDGFEWPRDSLIPWHRIDQVDWIEGED